MAKIALLSCTKAKKPYKCKARELYSPSPWFPTAYKFVKQYGADRVYILSTLYGLVHEDDEIEPYEATLNDCSDRERQQWAAGVINGLRRVADLEQDEFIIIAGKNYYQHLLPHLSHVYLPLQGLGIYDWVPKLKQLMLEHNTVNAQDSNPSYPSSSLSLQLHKILNTLPRHRFPLAMSNIPYNGIYVMFERGEYYQSYDRVVRVGTHVSPNRLRNRIRDHYLVENKDGSIFRKNIGRAMLNHDRDPYLKIWEYDLSKSNNRQILQHADPAYQADIERRVSEHIRSNISFCIIPVDNAQERLRLEEGLIATFNQDPDFKPSPHWLGRHSPIPEIRQSGMWLVKGLEERCLDEQEYLRIIQLLNRTSTEPKAGITTTAIDASLNQKVSSKRPATVNEEAFEQAILTLIEQARQNGQPYVDIVSREVHRLVGGYPGRNHKMRTCCKVMYRLMKPGNEVLAKPPKGLGASVKIRYHL